jgi:hypothetical protein
MRRATELQSESCLTAYPLRRANPNSGRAIADEAEAEAEPRLAVRSFPKLFRTSRSTPRRSGLRAGRSLTRTLALLLWEGVSTIYSGNWDQCVELAAAELGSSSV